MSDNVKIERTEDDRIAVTTVMESHADAMAVAQELSRRKRQELKGLDKVIAFDADISPKMREAAVVLVRLAGIAFALVLGTVVAITSGHAAVYIFPDAPMPDWLLFFLGAMTVVGGIWAADEFMKVTRDGVDDKEQKFRVFVFAAIAILCLLFDLVGVVTTRVAANSGAIQQLQNTRSEAEILRTQIKLAQNELVMLTPPAVPSAAYAEKIRAAMSEPTRTGKPVQTVGELMEICDQYVRDYCHEYQRAFSSIRYMRSEMIAAEQVERRGPELEAKIAGLQLQLSGLKLSNVNAVDEFFVMSDDPSEVEQKTKEVRFWRTILISGGQVLILAIVVLILLDDRHDRIARRRKARLEKQVGA